MPITRPTPASSSAAECPPPPRVPSRTSAEPPSNCDHFGGRAPGNDSRCPRCGALVEAGDRRSCYSEPSPTQRPTLARPTSRRPPTASDLHRPRRARRPARPAARRVVGTRARPRGRRARHVGGGRRHSISPPRRRTAAPTSSSRAAATARSTRSSMGSTDATSRSASCRSARPTISRGRREFRRTRIMPWMLSCDASPCASIRRR